MERQSLVRDASCLTPANLMTGESSTSISPILLIPSPFLYVAVHDTICTDDRDIWAVLYGLFLPILSLHLFPLANALNLLGAIIAKKEHIVVNQGCEHIKLKVQQG